MNSVTPQAFWQFHIFTDASEVLQTYLQTDTGTVQVTAILPAAFSEEQQMVLTSGSDARVEVWGLGLQVRHVCSSCHHKTPRHTSCGLGLEVVGHLIQQASEMTSGPIMVSMTSMYLGGRIRGRSFPHVA